MTSKVTRQICKPPRTQCLIKWRITTKWIDLEDWIRSKLGNSLTQFNATRCSQTHHKNKWEDQECHLPYKILHLSRQNILQWPSQEIVENESLTNTRKLKTTILINLTTKIIHCYNIILVTWISILKT